MRPAATVCSHARPHRTVVALARSHKALVAVRADAQRRGRVYPCSRNFFFGRSAQPFLDIEGLEKSRDFPRLASLAIAAAKRELKDAAQMGPCNLVTALDNASNGLCRVADAAELCRNVHPDRVFVDGGNAAVNSISSYMGEVNFDVSIYEALKRGEDSEDFQVMPLEPRAVLTHMRISMEHEGIHLPEELKAECLELQEREQILSFSCVQRQDQIRQSAADGHFWVPASGVREALGDSASRLPRRGGEKGSAGPEEIQVPMDPMWTEQILRNTMCPKSRRLCYNFQLTLDERGEEMMAELLFVRQRLARIRGYQTWNEYAQREALFKRPEHVQQFLRNAWQRLRPGILLDLERLAKSKEGVGLGPPVLEPWDVPMLLYRSNSAQRGEGTVVSEYMTYSSLIKGVELIVQRLLGLSFKAEAPKAGEVWHPSVQKFVLCDGGRRLGIMYLDPFVRTGKTVQSAQFTVQGSKRLPSGKRQTPITALVYSLRAGSAGLPLSQAVTFMHEIGHALHSLLSETNFQHLSGTRGTVDFVEFPSHLFEHFVLDADCLASYASHSTSGEPMSAEMRRRHREESSSFAHIEAAQQLMYAVMDQAFYSCLPSEDGSPFCAKTFAGEVHARVAEELAHYDAEIEGPFNGPFTALLGLSKPSKFDHLVHYGGSYYCYLFNRALSAHVWRHGFRADPFGQESGKRLRELLRGGSVDQSMEAIERLCPAAGGFRAEEVPLDALVDQLSGSG